MVKFELLDKCEEWGWKEHCITSAIPLCLSDKFLSTKICLIACSLLMSKRSAMTVLDSLFVTLCFDFWTNESNNLSTAWAWLFWCVLVSCLDLSMMSTFPSMAELSILHFTSLHFTSLGCVRLLFRSIFTSSLGNMDVLPWMQACMQINWVQLRVESVFVSKGSNYEPQYWLLGSDQADTNKRS